MRNQTKDDRYMIVTLPNGRQMEVPKNATQVLVAKEAIAAGYISEEEMYRGNKPLADAMGYKGPRQQTPQVQGIEDPTSSTEPFSGPFGSAPSSEMGQTSLNGFEGEESLKPSSIGSAGPAAGAQGRLSLSPDATQFQRGPSAVAGTPPPAKQPPPPERPQGSVFIGRDGRRVEIPQDGTTRFAMGGGRMVPVTRQEDPWTKSIGEFRNKSPELLAREGVFIREYLRGLEFYKDFNDQYLERSSNRSDKLEPRLQALYDKETGRIAEETVKWKKYIEKYEPYISSTISQDIDKLASSEKARDFYTIDKNGAIDVDPQKVSKYVDNALAAYGVKDTPNLDMRDMWTKSAMASIESVERQKAGMKKVEEAYGEVESKLVKPPDIDAPRKKIESIANKYSEKAKQEIDAFDKDVVSPQRQQLESEYNNAFSFIQKEAEKIGSIYSSGGMSKEQYDAAYSKLESQAKETEGAYKQKYSDLVKAVEQRVASVNFRWNQSYRTEAQAEQDAYNASIDAFNKQLQATYESPEVRLKIKQAYKEGYQQQAEKELRAQERSDKERYEKGIDPFDMSSGVAALDRYTNPFATMPFNRQMARLSERYVKGLSSAVKSFGTALGSTDLYEVGLAGENKWNLPQLENKGMKDLGSLAWFERQAELGGYMTPGIGATALTAAATAPMGGSGAALTGRFLLSGFSGWVSETGQITASVRSNVLEATGSIEKANKAAERAFDSQVAISASYLLEGAPFIKIPFLKAGRVMSTLTGFGAEYGQELFLQEGPQQIAEKRIMAEAKGDIKLGEGLMAAYDNFYQGVADMMAPVETITGTKPSEFEQLAVDLIGIGGMGAVGGYRDVGARNRQTANDIKSLLANDVIAERIKNGDFQWINSIVESRGEAFASSLVGQFHVAGQITNEQKVKFDRNIESAAILQDDVQRLGLKGDEALVYKALAGRASAALEVAKSEEKDIIKKVHEAEARELERQMESIAMGNGFTGAVVTTPNGKKIFMAEKEFKDAVNDTEFLGTVAMLGLQRNGGIQITNYGPGSDVALTEFWENVIEVQNGMSRDVGAVNKKYGTVVDYVVNTSSPEQSGIKVMAEGRPEDKANAEALLHRIGYNVIGYTPPAKVEPITEEELVAETVKSTKPTAEAPSVVAEEEFTIDDAKELVGKVVEYRGQEGYLDIDEGGKTTFTVVGGGKIYEIGTEEDMQALANVTEVPIDNVVNEDGSITIGNKTFVADIGAADITRDNDGGIYSVEIETDDGVKTFYGDLAATIIYENQLRTVRQDENLLAQIETNITTDAEIKSLIEQERDKQKRRLARRKARKGAKGPVSQRETKGTRTGDGKEQAAEVEGEAKDWTKEEMDEFNALMEREELDTIEKRMADFVAENKKHFSTTKGGVNTIRMKAPKAVKKAWADMQDTLEYKKLREAEQEQTPTADAVQERTTEEVGAQPVGPEVTGQEGGAGVGPSVQGPTAPQAGGPQGQVAPTTEPAAEGPVRPEAPAGPAPATAPTPNKKTVAKMKDLAKAESGTETNNDSRKAKAQKKVDALLNSDARLMEVRDNFDKAVEELEKAGKLQVSCRK